MHSVNWLIVHNCFETQIQNVNRTLSLRCSQTEMTIYDIFPDQTANWLKSFSFELSSGRNPNMYLAHDGRILLYFGGFRNGANDIEFPFDYNLGLFVLERIAPDIPSMQVTQHRIFEGETFADSLFHELDSGDYLFITMARKINQLDIVRLDRKLQTVAEKKIKFDQSMNHHLIDLEEKSGLLSVFTRNSAMGECLSPVNYDPKCRQLLVKTKIP